MSSGSGGPARRVLRWLAGSVLALAGVVAWVLMMQAAARGLSFEPNSDVAIASAVAARSVGIAWASTLTLLAAALALFTGHRWLALLGLPGLAVLLALIAPVGNGGALVLGLLASVVAALLTIWLETRHSLKMRQARERPLAGSPAGAAVRG